MAGRIAEAVAVSVLAAIVTAALAVPVLRAPSQRVFGMAIVGRHHDPFTVMEQFERPMGIGAFSQPVTDITGAMFARVVGAVAAYNWLVLLSFPFAAAAAYLLARHLTLSRTGAVLAALAYSFAPFHLAHAAYHPHIAQTQWVPLYLLALWRCLDKASPAAVAFLAVATIAVTLSNFYAGLIMAVMTPVAVATYWLAAVRQSSSTNATGVKTPGALPNTRSTWITVGTLAFIAASGFLYASSAAGAVVANPAAFAFPRADLFRYSAKWWSYLVPPVEHPLLGTFARQIWSEAGVREGLLEQQVSLGWGIVALGLVAVCCWVLRNRPSARTSHLPNLPHPPHLAHLPLRAVPVLVVMAAAALVCSLSPERTIGPFRFVRPSALLYTVVPMFRSYARFGVVVQLMAALLAGIGVDALRRSGSRYARGVAFVLVALAAGEYAVNPSTLWRDVLPTAAHRWVMQQPGRVRVLDCTPLNQESESVQWLTSHRVTLLQGRPGQDGSIGDCSDANLSRTLAANGYTHLLVRRPLADGLERSLLVDRPLSDGLRLAARFEDGMVFAVTAPVTAGEPGAQP